MSTEKMQKNIFEIQSIYTKDISFENPNTPDIFNVNWTPAIKINFNTFSKQIQKNIFEIILRIRVIVKIQDRIAFVCELDQAGLFSIPRLSENDLKHCLSAYCPNILFPYARECISNLISHGNFPQIHLAPINFDSIYFHYQKCKKNSSDLN